MKMTGAIRKQLLAFLEGFCDIISRRLISKFNKQQLESLVRGLPVIDIDWEATDQELQSCSLNIEISLRGMML